MNFRRSMLLVTSTPIEVTRMGREQRAKQAADANRARALGAYGWVLKCAYKKLGYLEGR